MDSVNKLLRSKILECIGNNHVPIVCKSKLSGLAPLAPLVQRWKDAPAASSPAPTLRLPQHQSNKHHPISS